jgi:hypothetical protein
MGMAKPEPSPCALGIRAGLQPRVYASREAAYRSAEGRSEATDLLPLFLGLCIFFLRFPPKKRMSSLKAT